MSVGMYFLCMCIYPSHVYLYACPLSCRVHSAEHCVQSSWRASQEARYLLLVTLLDVIIVCPRQLRHENPIEKKSLKPIYGSTKFFFFLVCIC